jgi:hypothetical protein
MRLHQLLLGRARDVKRLGFGPDHPRVQAVQKAMEDVEALIKERPLRIRSS